MIENCEDFCDFAPIEQCPIEQPEDVMTFDAMIEIHKSQQKQLTPEQKKVRNDKRKEYVKNLPIEKKREMGKRSTAYAKKRYNSDPEYRKRRLAINRKWANKKYHEDPLFRLKRQIKK